MQTLILVDLQRDFMPGGALAVQDGDQVVAIANRLIPRFDLVVATQDWHPVNHSSFASQHPGKNVGDQVDLDGITQRLWPDHCIQHSPGAAFHTALAIDQITHTFQKGTNPRIDSYSGFFDNGHRQSTGLEEFLRQHGVDQLHIMGLATDYCVKFTALDAAQLGFKTFLIEDGCRGVDVQPVDVQQAIDEMQAAGVQVISSNQFLEGRESH